MNKTEKMTKEQLLQYVARLQQAAAQAEAAALPRSSARSKPSPQPPQPLRRERRQRPRRTPNYSKATRPTWLVPYGTTSNTLPCPPQKRGALNALVVHALKGGKLMSAGASRQNLSRARRAVTGYITEARQAEAHDVVFDCLYCVPCITVSPEGDYMDIRRF